MLLLAPVASLLFISQVAAAPVAFDVGSETSQLTSRDDFVPLSRRDECSHNQGCSNCVRQHGCGFSKTTYQCERIGYHNGPFLITSLVGCPQMNQQQGPHVFPAINSDRLYHPGGTPAGTPTPHVAAEYGRIAGHVLHGHGSSSSTGGRHTTDSYLGANPKAKVTGYNDHTHISQFSGKTAWDSLHYSEADIRNMCSVAIHLRMQARLPQAAFVVQSPYGHPVCVETFGAGTGSCYPKGVQPPHQRLNEQC